MPKECPPEIDAMLISSLSTGCPVREAARLANVSVRTVYRRLANSEFHSCVTRTRWRDAEGSIGFLAHSSRQACERLVGLLNAKSEHVCLNAARSILTQMITLKEKLENETFLDEVQQLLNQTTPQMYVPQSDEETEVTLPTDVVFLPDEGKTWRWGASTGSDDSRRTGSAGTSRSYKSAKEEEAEAYANAVDEPAPPKPEPYVPAQPSPGLTPEEESFFAAMKSAETPDHQVSSSSSAPSEPMSHLEKPADLCQPAAVDSAQKSPEQQAPPADTKTASATTGWHSVPTPAERPVADVKQEETLRSGASTGSGDPRQTGDGADPCQTDKPQTEADRCRAEDQRRIYTTPLWMPPNTAGLPLHREIRVKYEWYLRVFAGEPQMRGSTWRFIEKAIEDYDDALKKIPPEERTEYDLEPLIIPYYPEDNLDNPIPGV